MSMAFQDKRENPAQSLGMLREFANRNQIETVETYTSTLEDALAVLSQGDGLVQLADLPTIVIPDLHARRPMLMAILSFCLNEGTYAGRQIFDLLQQGLIIVICVGDIVHSEERSDWVINNDGEWTEELLEREMIRSLGAGLMIMSLKIAYPRHFYCLRGNHDDIAGELSKDFRKFVGLKYDDQGKQVFKDGFPVMTDKRGESVIVRDWILTRQGWGQLFLQKWAQFEKSLPVFARGSYYVISHTLPQIALLEKDIRDINRPIDITLQLTSRRGINETALVGTLENFGIKDIIKHWFHGYTQVSMNTNDGKYEQSPNGMVIRLNNPKCYVFAYVPPSNAEHLFDPSRNVYIKSLAEETFHQ